MILASESPGAGQGGYEQSRLPGWPQHLSKSHLARAAIRFAEFHMLKSEMHLLLSFVFWA
jgi:hypothetical protein